MWYARQRSATPTSIVTSSAAMIPSVFRAPDVGGERKMGTPLLTASMPVIAVVPLAAARRRSHAVGTATAAGDGRGATIGVGAPPCTSAWTPPITRMAKIAATNRYVGTAKAAPLAHTPRQLTSVTSKSTARQSGTVYGRSTGDAETSAPTPAAIATATLSR